MTDKKADLATTHRKTLRNAGSSIGFVGPNTRLPTARQLRELDAERVRKQAIDTLERIESISRRQP